ncbi:MAG: leucyl/phenylalanyl-tRNA--protein transferase [Spirochaetaceae bacterium]
MSPGMLLSAYEQGIFPWYSEGEPILWHSPQPRFVLFPEEFHVSRRLRRTVRGNSFTVTFDRDFPQVIAGCKKIERLGQAGTWITDEMEAAYTELHELGYAHSVEVWRGDTLAGGLYGVSLGQIYFGESMFAQQRDASKVGFVTLADRLFGLGFRLIDSQVYTDHLARFGAREIPRDRYLALLDEALDGETLRGSWSRYEPG